MTTPSRRQPSPVAEMLDWLESETPFSLRGFGPAPYVRVEDYIENDTYVLRAELPGVDPEKDIELEVDAGTLTVRGEGREEEKDKRHHELHYGAFSRTVQLPRGVRAEDVKASYDNGVLEVRVPCPERAAESRRVPVTRST